MIFRIALSLLFAFGGIALGCTGEAAQVATEAPSSERLATLYTADGLEGTGATAIAEDPLADELIDADLGSLGALGIIDPDQSRDGVAWFAGAGNGLIRLDRNGFTRVAPELSLVTDMATAPDGALWMASSRGVFRLAPGAQTPELMGDNASPGPVARLAVGPDETIWVAGYQGIAHYSGGAWAAATPAGFDRTLIEDLAVDDAGALWILGAGGVARWKPSDGSVETLAPPTASATYYKDLTIASGEARILHSGGVLRSGEGATLKAARVDELPSGPRSIAGRRDGGWVVAGYRSIHWHGPRGKKEAVFGADRGSFTGQTIRALASDDGGRIWVATEFGLAVVPTDGDEAIVEWPYSALPVGSEGGTIRAIHIVGAGPSLPNIGDLGMMSASRPDMGAASR